MTKEITPTGITLLQDAALNKSTAFTEEERDQYKLRGLLPPAVGSMKSQLSRVLANMRRKASDIEKYIFLSALQDRNERLFYRLVIRTSRKLYRWFIPLPSVRPAVNLPISSDRKKGFT